MKELEKILKALANRQRLSILWHLKQRKQASVSELAGAIHLSMKSTSRHLAILKAVGIVHRERYGKNVIYHIKAQPDLATEAILKLLM
ncbi:MAG: metalloregulator ArsR/SmtB family transcription factor [bacterium]